MKNGRQRILQPRGDLLGPVDLWLHGGTLLAMKKTMLRLKLMEYRTLGRSGLKVPALSFGTGTFGGGRVLQGLGRQRRRGSHAASSTSASRPGPTCSTPPTSIRAAWPRRSWARPSRAGATRSSSPPRATFRIGPGPNDVGSSRYHLIRAVEASLRRLGTDYIDLYQLHGFDAMTPVEEVLSTLDDLVRAGKIRYIGCSNFSGWHLMKSLAVSEKYGLARYVAHQAYYSLVGRDYEWELMPLALDQKVGTVVWSPLGWGRLTGKIRRGQPLPETSRLQSKTATETARRSPTSTSIRVVDALDAVAKETGKTRPADRAQLAAAAADGGERHHRRPQRGATAAEPGRGRLEPDAGAGRPARRRERRDPAYPYWHQVGVLRPQPAADLVGRRPSAPRSRL